MRIHVSKLNCDIRFLESQPTEIFTINSSEIICKWKKILQNEYLKKKNIQYDRIHTQGSSHGKTRIIRRAHAEPEIVELVGHTYEQLKELEAKVGTQQWQWVNRY